ncbi:MAG: DUF559 domain-containing protein [Atopobiaceae bacterium]|nr:DUF559 domain-containing protein [Atopobiaceae bacterium]
MSYLLGRGSAVEWLRQNRQTQLVDPNARWTVPYPILEASRTRLKPYLPLLSGLTQPIQLIVWNRDDRRRTALSQSHVLTTQDGHYPAIHIADDLFSSTPEFTFLQMASLLDEAHLIFLGMELSGRYGLDANGVFPRDQACTPQMLTALIDNMPRIRGRTPARAAAPKVLDGAGSPMEAALALVLSTARELGGYGLERPELNHALPVEGRARKLWVDDFITPDLLWEAIKLVIEYDSDLHHTASSRIANDARRRDVLTEMGYRVITVTTEHMRSFREVERIADIVADALEANITLCDKEEHDARVAYQTRMRHIATHPEELVAIW